MKTLLLIALCCCVLIQVSGQGNSAWNRMKNGARSRSFAKKDSEGENKASGDNTGVNVDESAATGNSPSNRGRGPKFSQQGDGSSRRPDSAQNGRRGKGRWQRRNGGKDWSDVIKASWDTSLPSDNVINERGFVSNNNQVGFLMSTDTKLTNAGYNQSFAMIDFGAGKEAIRVELRDPEIAGFNRSANRRSREFWARKKHACFILDAPLTFMDFSEEIQLRSSFSWAGPIPTGNVKTFVARQANRLADLGTNGVIDRLCDKAAARGLAFSIVADSSVTEQMEKIMVTGHIDPLQPLVSVPYEIKIEAGLLPS